MEQKYGNKQINTNRHPNRLSHVPMPTAKTLSNIDNDLLFCRALVSLTFRRFEMKSSSLYGEDVIPFLYYRKKLVLSLQIWKEISKMSNRGCTGGGGIG